MPPVATANICGKHLDPSIAGLAGDHNAIAFRIFSTHLVCLNSASRMIQKSSAIAAIRRVNLDARKVLEGIPTHAVIERPVGYVFSGARLLDGRRRWRHNITHERAAIDVGPLTRRHRSRPGPLPARHGETKFLGGSVGRRRLCGEVFQPAASDRVYLVDSQPRDTFPRII